MFDENRLMQIAAALPDGCQLSPIDEHAYHLCRSETWCSDLVSQFPDYDSFRRLGLGVVVLKDGAVVSGASSYTRYRNGIEIEVVPPQGAGRRLRREADPGMPEKGSVPQLGRPHPDVPRSCRKAGISLQSYLYRS